MIDPLLNIAMPLPAQTSGPQDAAPGTPSFLAWMQPGQGEAGSNPGAPLAPHPVVEGPVPDPVEGNPFVVSPPPPGQASQPGGFGPLSDSTGMMLDATRWRDFVAATLELHVRNAQGEREVVAMPWRLMASGHFAQASAMTGLPGQVVPMTAAPAIPGGHAPPAIRADGSSIALHAQPVVAFGGNGVAVGAPPSQMPGRAQDDIAPLHAMSSHAPAAAEWLARWMKWIERDGRDAVVWLRDFSIDEDQAPRVADDLRRFAQSQGVSLERIVVNGRERWRNPQFHVASKSKE